MQIDCHHGAVYVLCRLAGMKSNFARIVAYASQQVDDAVFDHALKFKNGGVFYQTRTAHSILNWLRMADVNDAFQVWLPFHFIPAGKGSSICQRLITAPEGKTIELLKEKVTAAGSREYGLHWLGIFLHLYADAFSHQDFKGFYDAHNEIEIIFGLDRMPPRDTLLFFFSRCFSSLVPIGHAVAAKNPDIPYAVWSYSREGKKYEVNNLQERFIPGLKKIFAFLLSYLTENPRYGKSTSADSLNIKLKRIIKLLKVEGSSHFRHRQWLAAVHNNDFAFQDFNEIDKNLDYDSRTWFKRAVRAQKDGGPLNRLQNMAYNYHDFYKRENFVQTDWVYFMRAAGIHRYKVLHEILPACGLQVG